MNKPRPDSTGRRRRFAKAIVEIFVALSDSLSCINDAAAAEIDAQRRSDDLFPTVFRNKARP